MLSILKTNMDHHYSLGLYTPVSCRLPSRSTTGSDPQFFLRTQTVHGSKLHSAYKLAKLWQNVSHRETDHATARPCGMCIAQLQCMSLPRTHFSTNPTLVELRGLGIWRSTHHWYTPTVRPMVDLLYKLNEMWNVLQKEDEHRALSNADTKYDALTHIWALKTTQNEFKWQQNCKHSDVRHFQIA